MQKKEKRKGKKKSYSWEWVKIRPKAFKEKKMSPVSLPITFFWAFFNFSLGMHFSRTAWSLSIQPWARVLLSGWAEKYLHCLYQSRNQRQRSSNYYVELAQSFHQSGLNILVVYIKFAFLFDVKITCSYMKAVKKLWLYWLGAWHVNLLSFKIKKHNLIACATLHECQCEFKCFLE